MRFFLLPITSRRVLLYCERLETHSHQQQSTLMDKAQTRAAKLWADWEKKPTGSWQNRITVYGNAGLRRIAFEEWGLKSVPPLSTRRREEIAAAFGETKEKEEQEKGGKVMGVQDRATSATTASNTASTEALAAARTRSPTMAPVEVLYPASIIPPKNVAGVLERLSTEREPLHRKRLIWCLVGMPFTAPIAIIPLIPNLPFFYLVYRAWSHWRALSGGKHIQYLLQHNALTYSPSPVLDSIYAQEKAAQAFTTPPSARISENGDGKPGKVSEKEKADEEEEDERLLLSHPGSSKAISEAFESHPLEIELERAIWQVETSLEKQRKQKQEAHQQQQQQQQLPPHPGTTQSEKNNPLATSNRNIEKQKLP